MWHESVNWWQKFLALSLNVVSKIIILTAIEWTANCRHWIYHIGIVVSTGLPTVSWNDLAKDVKVILPQAEVAQGVLGRLRPRIFLTFSTTRVVGHQPYAPATFTPGEIPGTHFQRLSRTQGTWFHWEPRKKSPVTPLGIDLGTDRLVAQCLNH